MNTLQKNFNASTRFSTRWILTSALALLFLNLPTFASGADSPLANFKNGKAIVIDVREEAETKAPQGMVKGARWLATSEIQKDSPIAKEFIKNIDQSKLVYVYCASGRRAGIFVEQLKKLGYQAENIGGIADVTAAGFPIFRPE